MTEGGFFDRKTRSPTGLTLVIAMHAAALGALALVKGPEIFTPRPPIDVYDIPIPPAPEPEPEPRPVQEPRQQPSVLDRVEPLVPRPADEPVAQDPPLPPLRPFGDSGPPTAPEARSDPPPPPPVRTAAEFDSRYAGDLQPPYPPSEQRAQRNGSVRVRLIIGADGRVKTIERLSATSDAFWRSTERHALARWRFRPATEDGRPVESAKTMNVFFRIEA
ncbi:MAG TPA: TonB family protein [Allosphingosinicella sp.]|nr:TonB family protein [Allosphingosinicella sp.]